MITMVYSIISSALLWCSAIIFVEAVTEIVVESEIFSKVRSWFQDKSDFFGSLIRCGFCFSVWVSIFTSWVLPGSFTEWMIVDIVVKTIILWRMSNVWHELLSRWFHRHPFGNRELIIEDDDEE